MIYHLKRYLVAGLALMMCTAVQAETATVAIDGTDIQVPQHRPGLDGDLILHGTGLLKAGLVFKVYAAALYLPDGLDPTRALADVPKQLDVYYLHKTPAKAMIKAATKAIERNLGEEAWLELKPRVDALHAVFRDGAKGGVASIVYHPETGLRYELDGESQLVIHDADLAAAYFGVWLGRHPSSGSMKKQLMTPVAINEDNA